MADGGRRAEGWLRAVGCGRLVAGGWTPGAASVWCPPSGGPWTAPAPGANRRPSTPP